MSQSDVVLGIDLGTTYSVVAFVDDSGKPQIIRNRDGNSSTPSVVLFESENIVIGANAKDQSMLSAESVVQFVKRNMGNPDYRFTAPDGRQYPAEAISALILKYLKEDAEAVLGHECRYAVITVPAYFNDAQRKATQDAASIAGLNALRIINEPTAAALAYGVGGSGRTENVLIYDLGGGTFDVTIMQVKSDELDVKTTDGDKELGGKDWDDALIEYVRDEIRKQGGKISDGDLNTLQELRERCEKAKLQLSAREKTTVAIAVSGRRFSVDITREKFETLTEVLVNRTLTLTEGCLSAADFGWSDIDKILLVGGSSRLPAVVRNMQTASGKTPSRELDPDLVVAMGAAILGAKTPIPTSGGRTALPSAASKMPAFSVSDICSHSLGTVVHDEDDNPINSIILPKDTKIPCSVAKDFQTASDNQTKLRVQVTQGEDESLDYVQIIGETTVKIPPYPRGAPVRIEYAYDVDGIIRVRVKDLTPDKPLDLGEFAIDRSANLGDDELSALKRRIDSLLTE
jgi:molecular chaperone DnaK